jgi:hypothetical protein
MNYENYCAVLERIEKNPDEWNQAYWFRDGCATAYCFAGHAATLKLGNEPHDSHVVRFAARDFLGTHIDFSVWLFAEDRTLDDFRRVRLMHARTRLAWAVKNYQDGVAAA